MRTVDFCLDEALRLRKLASDCTNNYLRIELLNRAAEFEDLAYSAGDQQQDANAQTRSQARPINRLVGIQHAAAVALSCLLRPRNRAAGTPHQRILERLCADAVSH